MTLNSRAKIVLAIAVLGVAGFGQGPDDFLRVSGGTMTGAIDMNGHDLVEASDVIADFVYAPVWQSPPDYVFGENYALRPLPELERFVKENGHLPEVPSTGDFEEKGLDAAQTNLVLLKKLEELFLYRIALEKRIEALEGNP